MAASLIILLMTGGVLAAEQSADTDLEWTKRILGSKHDLTSLNKRVGVDAMEGVAFSDYGNPCIYCHIPPSNSIAVPQPGQLEGWNRIRPLSGKYKRYSSQTMDSKQGEPSNISLLCLSCHDGTMAVDHVVQTPQGWESGGEMALHMRLGTSDDINSCGKCHDGSVAHGVRFKAIGTDLGNDHPISIRYAGLGLGVPGFRSVDHPQGFNNGVKLFEGNIECATCHDVHNPQSEMLLRTDGEKLCVTCHTN